MRLKTVERFITPELKTFEDKVLSSESRALAHEKELYEQILDYLLSWLNPLQAAAQALAQLDVLNTLAERAVTLKWNAPKFSQQPGMEIIDGRHPVVEQVSSEPFIANDTIFTAERRMLIITGPNMGGKSTYMRQTALIVLLAHIGSYVPAQSASIGPIDRIFTRIGAADDLAGGRSTFMVEMTETANILYNATDCSLVLMDEIGRGTSTFDGLSLAWATAEYLAQKINAFTLFATHYFELTQLGEELNNVMNVHLNALEHQEQIIFMHKVKEGPANQSYGIQVAKLAGVPRPVVQLAYKKLHQLEQHYHQTPDLFTNIEESTPYPLFSPASDSNPLLTALNEIRPDEMSPREALDFIYRLLQIKNTLS